MKTILKAAALSLLSICIFSACGSDEDEFSILGIWKLSEVSAQDCDGVDNTTLSFAQSADGLCIMEDGQEFCLDVTLNFKEDGTVVFTTKFSADIAGIMLDQMDDTNGTWMLNGDILTLCDEDNDCNDIDISSSTQTITYSQYDEDFMCTLSLSLEKQ